MTKKTFTLLELVIVLLIIGALTTMAIGQYLDSQKLSKRSIFESNINEIAKALSVYKSNSILYGNQTNSYPISLVDSQFEALFKQEPKNPYTSKPMLSDNPADSGIQYVSDGTSYKLCIVQRDVDDVNNNGIVDEVLPLSTKTACIGNTQTSVGVTFTRDSIAYKSDGSQVAVNVPRFEAGKFGQGILIEEGTTNLLPSNDAQGKTQFNPNNYSYSSNTLETSFGLNDLYSLKSVQLVVTTNKGFYSSFYPTVAGNVYTFSYYVYNATSTSHNFTARLIFYDGSGNLVQIFESNSVPVPAQQWKRISVTATAPSDSTQCRVAGWESGTTSQVGDVYYFDNFQLEAKPYATSFIDGTRSSELLTIPTAGVLNPQEGTVEFWVYPFNTVKTVVYDRSLFASVSSPPGVFYSNITPNQQLRFVYDNNGTSVMLVGGTIPNLSWSYITVRWNASGVAYFVNGKLVASSTKPITSINGTSLYIGCWGTLHANALHANALFDDLRISSRARTDEEIAAAYQSGQSLPVDAWTTLKLDFNGDLSTQSGVIP